MWQATHTPQRQTSPEPGSQIFGPKNGDSCAHGSQSGALWRCRNVQHAPIGRELQTTGHRGCSLDPSELACDSCLLEQFDFPGTKNAGWTLANKRRVLLSGSAAVFLDLSAGQVAQPSRSMCVRFNATTTGPWWPRRDPAFAGVPVTNCSKPILWSFGCNSRCPIIQPCAATQNTPKCGPGHTPPMQ